MERPEPTSSPFVRVERVLLWLLLPAFAISLVLVLRLSGRVDTLEQSLASASASIPAEQAGRGGRRAGGIAGKLKMSGEEREQIVRTRLEGYIAGSTLDEQAAAGLRSALEELLEEAARLRQARKSGEITAEASRERLQQARADMLGRAQQMLGEQEGETLSQTLFPTSPTEEPPSEE